MELKDAVGALAALAHETRLAAFRLVIAAGPEGMPAGRIAELLGVRPSTLSFHLSELVVAGLLEAHRDRRQIFYAPDYVGTRRLMAFLTEDCCGGRPELCLPAQTGPAAATAEAKPDQGDRAMTEKPRLDRPYNVLFLCTGNSARSVMAEAAMGRHGAGRFVAYSAGSQPKGQVHPLTLELLSAFNYRTDGFRSKSWDAFARPDSPPLDFVFTVCDNAANEVCPVWPGQPMTAHWGVEDPAAFVGPHDKALKLFRRVYLELESRIKIFASLRLEGLDRLALQAHLHDIGKGVAVSEPAE